MANKCLMLMLFSWFFVALCQGRVGGGGGGDQPPCMKELLPCKAYLHQPSTPTPSCCVPLNKFVSTDAKCLCDVFTQEDALNLAKGCGATVDTSFCNIGPSLDKNLTAGGAQSKLSLGKKKKDKKKKKKKKKEKSAANPLSKFRGSSVLVVLICMEYLLL
ncbi:hypothetical protein LIER_28031 [Lithospermum erythrorhizon]|uniref:Bifunctional inhibitor/plant lipid transfer protein/seed storage helical domain-containing protein n=1 Tax=Lithospermum erythrorhizon TaxID=34254 RepID=A0AAV3RHU0_LITER